MIDIDRARRAVEDVLAVEILAPGMVRVVTLGGAYTVDAHGEGCSCEDKQYNLGPGELCKHHAAALLATSDDYPTPFLVVEDFNERTDPAFDIEMPARIGRNRTFDAFRPDGGECEDCAALPGEFPCAECYIKGNAELPGAES